MAGLDSTGFVNKDVDTIIAELEAGEKDAFGQSVNVRPTSVFGHLNGIFGTKFAELWDVGNDVWASQNPDTATGVSLDQLCQLTGVTREAALQSTVSLALSGTNGTAIPAFRRVKNVATGTYWTNPLSATIGAATSTYVDFVSEEYGEIIGLAGTLTVIDTPVSGWASVTNELDAVLGQEGESDAELRVRRAALLVSTGKATVDAIQANMLKTTGVLDAAVLENVTSLTDANGLPPKSFEVIVDGGTANAIAQTVWDNKPAGISAYGSSTGTAVDALGNNRIMGYTVVTPRNAYVAVTATTGTGYSGATADFAAAFTAYGTTRKISDDVSHNALIAAAFVAGVTDITDLRADFSAAPTATSNLPVGIRERAKFDSSRVTVYIA